MEEITIFNKERFAIHDGKGIRTLIFAKGCSLQCAWCSNPEGQKPYKEVWALEEKCVGCGACIEACPNDAIYRDEDGTVKTDKSKCKNCGECVSACPQYARQFVGEDKTTQFLLQEVLKDLDSYRSTGGGMTVGGGEPLYQAKEVTELLWRCKQYGLSTGIETCGYGKWDDLDNMSEFLDFVFFDIKHMDSEVHKKLTGVSNDLIIMNIKRLSRKGIPMAVSVPLVPGCNDDEGNLERTAKFAKNLESLIRMRLLPYHRFGVSKYARLGRKYPLDGAPLLEDFQVQKAKAIFQDYGLKVEVGY